MYRRDTIAAISTPLGEGGIGIVRVSGDLCGEIAARIFTRGASGGLESHRFYYGEIRRPEDGTIVDEVLVVMMRAPRSYTREDVLEIHCHGGFFVVQRVLDTVLAAGARLAEAGEFTKRAFLNGRIDLVQAESVIDLIRCTTDEALVLTQGQREGELTSRLHRIRDAVVSALAVVEAYIDFPDEDLPPHDFDEIRGRLSAAFDETARLLATFEEGRSLREGVSVVITGRPNVGKSSLMNALLQEKRAIVTMVPGTTRDVIEEVINLRGLPVRVLDTAGIRDTVDEIEREGVARSREKVAQADLVLFVVDGSEPFSPDDRIILDLLSGKRFIMVVNKVDLPRRLALPDGLSILTAGISTATGEGLFDLQQIIHDTFVTRSALDSRDRVAISRARHRDALVKCQSSLAVSLDRLAEKSPPEILAIELRDVLHALGLVTGETTTDDVLALIFSQFCIGK